MIKKFFDYVTLELCSGNGASGAVSFRREKKVPRGGPDGGDGGRGGHIILETDRQLSSFSHLYGKRIFKAPNGLPGSGRRRFGQDGADLVVKVPVGTVIKTLSNIVIHEFKSYPEQLIFLKGGSGGKGNYHFKTSTNQKPYYAQKGLPGKTAKLIMEVKLIADIGLVGFPNAGKSTLLSVLTNAHPRIASYPFTTLRPELGVYRFNQFETLTIADIPGIIEGAHQGEGLGIQFLRHIERTSYLLYLIDCQDQDPLQKLNQLRYEMKQHSELLHQKDFTIVISKIDLIDPTKKTSFKQAILKLLAPLEHQVVFFSSLTLEGMDSIKEIFSRITSS